MVATPMGQDLLHVFYARKTLGAAEEVPKLRNAFAMQDTLEDQKVAVFLAQKASTKLLMDLISA